MVSCPVRQTNALLLHPTHYETSASRHAAERFATQMLKLQRKNK